MTARHNRVIGKGETFTLNFDLYDDGDNLVDFTGHTVDLHVSKNKNTPVGTYPAVTNSTGNVLIKVADEETDAWPVGKLSYYCNHTAPNGEEKWILFGALTVMDGGQL